MVGVAVNVTGVPAQTGLADSAMVMLTALPGLMKISILVDAPVPQVLVPKTETFPLVVKGPKSTVIEFVLVPEMMVLPEGTLQTYPVA